MRALHRALVVACAAALLASGCERESRSFEPPATGARVPSALDRAAMFSKYEDSAPAVANGKRLFTWYNCSGCHAAGGGASGPALMDDVWIYGSDPLTIYQTIVNGRPNGMPGFGNRIPEDQVWQLVAYVRSLGGLGSSDAAPNRDDALLTRPPEAQLDKQKPKTATAAGASSH